MLTKDHDDFEAQSYTSVPYLNETQNQPWMKTSAQESQMKIIGWSMLGAVLISASAIAQGLSSEERVDIYGCWQMIIAPATESSDVSRGRMTPKLQFCFHRGGAIFGFFAEETGHAGDLQKSWSFRAPSTLVIDGEPCAMQGNVGDRHFRLSNCTYKGEWLFECDLANDAVGCSTK
jgi:hypothetical protein